MSKSRINSLQGLRVVAFLAICSGHCGVTKLGAWGVSIFFVLSGFLMTYGYFDNSCTINIKSSLTNAIKRVGRLYPLHILMMVAAIVYIIFIGKGQVTIFELLPNILLIQSWIPQMGIYFSLNGVSWFLSSILFAYFLFPFLLATVKKVKNTNHLITLSVIVLIAQVLISCGAEVLAETTDSLTDFLHWTTYICPVIRGGDFLVGICIAVIYLRRESNENYLKSTLLEVLSFILAILTNILYVHGVWIFNDERFCNSIVYLPSTALIVYFMARGRGVISSLLSKRIIVMFGNISGYMFLIHSMVIAYVRTFLQITEKFSYVRLFILTLPITIVASLIYIKCAERKKCARL